MTPEEFAVASTCYWFDRAANFEEVVWHAYLARLPEHAEIALLNSARQKLFKARQKRTRPGLDDKILTSWNALAIKGVARAGRVFNRSDWIMLAQHAVDFIREKLWIDNKLLTTCKVGKQPI